MWYIGNDGTCVRFRILSDKQKKKAVPHRKRSFFLLRVASTYSLYICAAIIQFISTKMPKPRHTFPIGIQSDVLILRKSDLIAFWRSHRLRLHWPVSCPTLSVISDAPQFFLLYPGGMPSFSCPRAHQTNLPMALLFSEFLYSFVRHVQG